MAHYDEPTKKFMEDVAGRDVKDGSKKDIIARQGINLLKDIATTPKTKIPEKIIRRAIATATSLSPAHMEKNAGIKLFNYLNMHYNDSWHSWAPETLWQTLDHDGYDIDQESREAIQAFQVVVTTNFPFEEWHVFENIGHAFNGNHVDFGTLQPLDMDEIAYTVSLLQDIRPGEEFEDEVKAYIAAAAKNSGMVYLPEDLYPKGCQQFLNDLGNDLKLAEEVKKHYPAKGTEENALGIQLARLSEVRDYVEE